MPNQDSGRVTVLGYACKARRGAETGERGNNAEHSVCAGFVAYTHGQTHAPAVTESKHDRLVPRHAAVSSYSSPLVGAAKSKILKTPEIDILDILASLNLCYIYHLMSLDVTGPADSA